MAAHPLIIPLPKFTSYSDAFLGPAVCSAKQLQNLNLPVPASIFLPPSTLELFYQTSPQRQRVIDLFRKLTELESGANQTRVISQLKSTIATLAINRQLVHTLTDWYHDYLEGEEVVTVAAHIPDLSHQSAKGNVNFIESILRVWAESLELCLIKNGQSPQACLTPTGIFVQAQPKIELTGIIFSNHPQKLTKASLVVYLWQQDCIAQKQPDEILDLDMRSGMILKRHHLPTTDKPSTPISISSEQLVTIVSCGSRIKQHHLQDTSARFIISNQRVLFTQLPTHYQLDLISNSKSKTATKLLLHTSVISDVKRTAEISDGVGIWDVDLSNQNTQLLLQNIQSLQQFSPPNQVLLLRPSSTVSNQNWHHYHQFFVKATTELKRPIAFLPSQLQLPEHWLAIASLPIFKTPTTQPKPLWLEIATPAMALALRSLDLSQLGGLVINQPQLMFWAVGGESLTKIDQLSSPHLHLVFTQILKSIMLVIKSQVLTKPIPIWVELNQTDPHLVGAIINSGCHAVLSSAAKLSTMRGYINQAEKDIWRRRVAI